MAFDTIQIIRGIECIVQSSSIQDLVTPLGFPETRVRVNQGLARLRVASARLAPLANELRHSVAPRPESGRTKV